MSNISTAPADGKSRQSQEIDLDALTRYLEAEQAQADAATSVEAFLHTAKLSGGVVRHA
ncbi:hypothetical protein [Paraburkholderia sp.]|jgi:hypothetical protein|uniref:hypothetical protein n=1 Tax=Paraburkholderia sp. TaxID=1926495 RepID=UPI002F41E1B7